VAPMVDRMPDASCGCIGCSRDPPVLMAGDPGLPNSRARRRAQKPANGRRAGLIFERGR